MARGKVINASNWLTLAGASLYLLTVAMPVGAPQEALNAQSPLLSKRANSTKPTWHTGPASTPPETEVVPPPRPTPPPAKSLHAQSNTEAEEKVGTKNEAITSAGSPAGPRLGSAWPGQAPSLQKTAGSDLGSLDPEAQRIQDELYRLRNDAGARRAFYDELRRTVDQVRTGARDEDSKNPASAPPAWRHFHDAPGKPPNPPVADPPEDSPPVKSGPPQAFLGVQGGGLPDQSSVPPFAGEGRGAREPRFTNATVDRAAYLRVVHWAKANDAPVPLALGVAWIESRLQTYPARGAAGEVGMFQILPERCRMEGWPPERLKEPEFNAWLGTLLLARYYQEEGSWTRAAAKYVAGPAVFDRAYSSDMWAYINWYARSVESYAGYFSRYQS